MCHIIILDISLDADHDLNLYFGVTFCSDQSLQTTISLNGTKASLTHPPPAED
jgi:hypothetical protein